MSLPVARRAWDAEVLVGHAAGAGDSAGDVKGGEDDGDVGSVVGVSVIDVDDATGPPVSEGAIAQAGAASDRCAVEVRGAVGAGAVGGDELVVDAEGDASGARAFAGGVDRASVVGADARGVLGDIERGAVGELALEDQTAYRHAVKSAS